MICSGCGFSGKGGFSGAKKKQGPCPPRITIKGKKKRGKLTPALLTMSQPHHPRKKGGRSFPLAMTTNIVESDGSR